MFEELARPGGVTRLALNAQRLTKGNFRPDWVKVAALDREWAQQALVTGHEKA